MKKFKIIIMKKIKNPVTVADHLNNQMVDLYMKEKEQPKDESKEAKDGGEGFTGGDWYLDIGDFYRLQDSNEIYLRSNDGDESFDICDFGCDETGKAEANAALIAQSKNMYYALKGMLEQFDHEGNRHPASIKARQFAREVFQKATPKK